MSWSSPSSVGSDAAELVDGVPAVNVSVNTLTDLGLVVAHTGEEKAYDVDQMLNNVGEVVDDDDSDAGDTGKRVDEADDSDAGDTREGVSEIDDGDAGDTREVVDVVKAQEAFQPGSTPMDNGKRYLGSLSVFTLCLIAVLTSLDPANNLVGVIEVTDLVTHHVVDVKFHNISMRRAYHFADEFRYDMATLGQRGAIYACQPDTTHPAHVLYKPYSSWTSHAEWKYELRGGTSVVGVAAGGSPASESLRKDVNIENLGNVILATSDGELIFLSGSGVERACMSLPGTFITMVAGSEWVFLVTRDGSTTTDGSQNLMGRLIKFSDFCVLQKDNLPIPKHHILKWVRVTEEGVSL